MSDLTPPADRPTGPVSSAHPDVDELSAYADGELEGLRGDEVTAHVDSCADCSDDLRALRLVSAELAALPTPAMPTDVAARLDEAIASERRGKSAGAANVLPARRRTGPGWASGAAAAVIIGLVAVIGIGAVSQLDTADHKDATGAAAAPGQLGAAESAGTVIYTSGTNYARQQLGRQVSELLNPSQVNTAGKTLSEQQYSFDSAATPPPARASGPAQATAGSGVEGLRRLRDSAATDSALLVACLKTVHPDVAPVAVDFGRFEGKDALVVVLPSDPGFLEVYVVGPKCGVADDADVLYRRLIRTP